MAKEKTSDRAVATKGDPIATDDPVVTPGEDNPPDEGGWMDNPVMQEALDRNRTALGTVGKSLNKLGSLFDVANDLDLFNPKGTAAAYSATEEMRLLEGLRGSPQEDAVLTAARDAIAAGRKIKFVCGIEKPKDVAEIHFHVSATASETVIEIVSGPAHP